MNHRSSAAIARSHEHGERALAGRERSFGVGEVGAIEGAAGVVARECVEFIDVGQQFGRSALAQASDQRGPPFGRGEGARLTDAFDDATDKRGAAGGIRLARGQGQHLSAGPGVARETAVDEVGRPGMLAESGEGEATGSVRTHERLDTIPKEQRNIMILRVFGAGEQRLGDGRALGQRQRGKRRR